MLNVNSNNIFVFSRAELFCDILKCKYYLFQVVHSSCISQLSESASSNIYGVIESHFVCKK